MEIAKKRILTRKRKKSHIRKLITGTNNRPRVSVFRSANHIYAQAIDDTKGVTLYSACTCDKDIREQIDGYKGNKKAANITGNVLGKKLVKGGYKEIVFDRNGFLFHGRVKSLADGIRETGVKF